MEEHAPTTQNKTKRFEYLMFLRNLISVYNLKNLQYRKNIIKKYQISKDMLKEMYQSINGYSNI